MPKKFKGENSKAVDAKARKAADENVKQERKQKETEDAKWVDDDKHIKKKEQRKDDKESKRAEQLKRKLEADKLLEEEMTAIKPAKPPPSAKVTRAQIEDHKRKVQAQGDQAHEQDKIPVNELPLEENFNRLEIEGEARGVEEALTVLKDNKQDKVDMNPEKRVKAAFTAFEERRLPQLKAENSNLRLSQLKQLLKKEWQKSPENPLNERFL